MIFDNIMACCTRISNNVALRNITFKNKYLPSLLYSRHFCSKDNDAKDESTGADDSMSKNEPEKSDDKTSKRSRASRFKAEPISDEKKEAARQKLMSLLSEMTVISDSPAKSSTKLNIAKAVKRISKKERLSQMEEKKMTPEKEMDMAVKAVASNFKEDSEIVEFQLTEKLKTFESQETEDTPLVDEKISVDLMSSVEEVADTISENPIPPRSELTKRLMRLSLDENVKFDQKPMKSVIEGMIIKSQLSGEKPHKVERPQATERRMAVKRLPAAIKLEKIDLFGARPLNIFEPGSENKPESLNIFWQKLQEREARLLTQFAPSNAFEEMIMWTEQGKHWKFPIDNETEMGAEEKVGFNEHVFLEQHLKGFPTRGPIRHFMELVCVGLSKNPYVSVERKIENIEWFRNYFKEKEEILREAGAIE